MTEALSFDELVGRLTPALRRYLEHFLDDASLADDLLQETLLRISESLGRFEGRSSLETWAFGVATHTAIDHLRRSSAGARIVAIEDGDVLPSAVDEVDQPMIVDEMSSCVREEVDRLPGHYRAALVLHDMEGKTAQQTAEICGCSLATAKIRIHRARARLKKALQEDCSFYYDPQQVLRCDRKSSGGRPA